MNSSVAAAIAVIGVMAAIGFAYCAVTLIAWLAERRRRRRGSAQVAARIYEPFCPTRMRCRCPMQADGADRAVRLRCFMREGIYGATGVIDNQPTALPFFTTIALAGLALLLLLDPMLDTPILWGAALTETQRADIPEWLKWIWAAAAVTGALALAGSAFFLPKMRIGRQWLVLHDDGRIGARGADFPVLDPRRPFAARREVLAEHDCVLIRQDGNEVALVLGRIPSAPKLRRLNIRQLTPPHTYAVGLGLAVRLAERHLDRHFLTGGGASRLAD